MTPCAIRSHPSRAVIHVRAGADAGSHAVPEPACGDGSESEVAADVSMPGISSIAWPEWSCPAMPRSDSCASDQPASRLTARKHRSTARTRNITPPLPSKSAELRTRPANSGRAVRHKTRNQIRRGCMPSRLPEEACRFSMLRISVTPAAGWASRMAGRA